MNSMPDGNDTAGGRRTARWSTSVAATLVLCACQQLPYRAAPLAAVPVWDAQSAAASSADVRAVVDERWWLRLQDPAVDSLVGTALADSPDLAQALARIDAAQAAVGGARAMGNATVAGNASIIRGSSQVSSNSSSTQVGSVGTLGLSFNWELDLFGRIRAGREAAQLRLDARSADAQSTQVALVAQIVGRVVDWRACDFAVRAREWEVSSREATEALIRRRVTVGMAAAADAARAVSDVAIARTDAITQAQGCRLDVNALVALTGLQAGLVRAQLSAPPRFGATACTLTGELPGTSCAAPVGFEVGTVVPEVVPMQLALPAVVLASHPSVVAAQREAAAAWSDIGGARASRYPRLNLGALLTGQWLGVGSQALNFSTWAVGPGVAGAIVDGGAAESQIDSAEARYRESAAKVVAVVRASAQDIENALVADNSAQARAEPTQQALRAALLSLRITEVQWHSGATTLLALEDARRQYSRAQSNAVLAAKDRAQAWVGLVRATCNQGLLSLRTDPEN